MRQKIINVVAIVPIAVFIFYPTRHASNYSYVKPSEIYSELAQTPDEEVEATPCSDYFYRQLVESGEEINVEYILQNTTSKTVLPGGEYIPINCKPLFKSAIIVPYRDREEHLQIFIDFIHKFLQGQNIHYKVFVVEQTDDFPFNRGKLMNVGAHEAMNSNYPCLILHDVDLLPLNKGQIYACTKQPRHLASNMDRFRYHLPYLSFTGGVFSIQSNQYREINGMSNRFYGWGGEDDDFYIRLQTSKLIPCRFPPEYNKYKMLRHRRADPSETRWDQLKEAEDKKISDGFNTLPNTYQVVMERLYTHVLV